MIDPWYLIKNVDRLDTPALVVYPERVQDNIAQLVASIDDISRLRPHIKTHKTKEVTYMLQSAGINKFKCATIAEAELLGMCNANDVLLAYQPNGANLLRFIDLIFTYPQTKFSCLVDNIEMANIFSNIAMSKQVSLDVYIDLNVGMNRTGIVPQDAMALYEELKNLSYINTKGLHVYDGHIHEPDLDLRTQKCNAAYDSVTRLQNAIYHYDNTVMRVIAGGTPTYPIHAQRANIECSPGTFVYWDYGYLHAFEEQKYLPAALVLSRIISKPSDNKICVDLGHKSIAAENPLERRVHFLNAPDAKFISQSEEHLVLEVKDINDYKIGDVLYGMPIHVCPTCALYERAYTVQNGEMSDEEWMILARDRKINI
jgi:D-threonine aldolase